MSKLANSSSIRPASILERSRMSLIRERRWRPEERTSWRYSACFSFTSPNIRSWRTSEKPMMALRGVRSSWDMLARNSDLCWLASSSCRPLSSISRNRRAFWMAGADQQIAEAALVGVRLRDVGDLRGLARLCRTTHEAFALPKRQRPKRLDDLRIEIVGRANVEHLGRLVVLGDRAGVRARELAGARDDRAEHCLDVEGRADRLADLAQGLQLLDRSGQVLGSGLQFLEEADVLDGDDSLVGEGLDKGDLLVGEWPDLAPPCRDHPDKGVLPKHRDGQDRPRAFDSVEVPRRILRIILEVSNVDYFPF